MSHTYHIATLNINAIAAPSRSNLLAQFTTQHALDVVFLQEVTQAAVTYVPGYTSHINIGDERRGTAILIKEGIPSRHILRLPSGRGIAAIIHDIWYANVYAPSGTERRKQREDFFNRHLPNILPTTPNNIILAGDFNSIIDPRDTTGTTPHSKH